MKHIESPKAVKPIGPYSQGIVVRRDGLRLRDGRHRPRDQLDGPGGIKEQTSQVLENVKAVLEAGGSSLEKVLKVTVYLKVGSDFKEMNEVYSSYFGNHKPTRTTVVAGFVKDGILVENRLHRLALGPGND